MALVIRPEMGNIASVVRGNQEGERYAPQQQAMVGRTRSQSAPGT
jgi:hypothetical protein